jgi:hypothetical protein
LLEVILEVILDLDLLLDVSEAFTDGIPSAHHGGLTLARTDACSVRDHRPGRAAKLLACLFPAVDPAIKGLVWLVQAERSSMSSHPSIPDICYCNYPQEQPPE